MSDEIQAQGAPAERMAKVRAPRKPRAPRASKNDGASMLNDPAVQAMVAKAIAEGVAQATARIASELQARRNETAVSAAGGDDLRFAKELAMQFAQMADQGAKIKRVSPAEMLRREDARARMENLLVEARANGDRPLYKVMKEMYLAETFIRPTWVDSNHIQRVTEIAWDGCPNEHMVPVNEIARTIFGAFMASIGDATPKMADQARSALKITHRPDQADVPAVGRPRHGGLDYVGRANPGAVVQTNVLGTLAAPARQLA